MNWLHKPAIQWSSDVPPARRDDATTCVYWDPDLIALIQSQSNPSMNGEIEDESSISYGALIVAAVSVVHSLRQRLGGEIAIPPSVTQKVGVCIVVAIPEGPLLPLAILVVHLLNEPTMVDSEAATLFAVLVPLEPNEGKERLRHMLMDLRPAMILCLSGNDSMRLEDIVGSIEPVDASLARRRLVSSLSTDACRFRRVTPGRHCRKRHQGRSLLSD